MKKEFQKLVGNIENGIKARGFFFVLYKQMNVITGGRFGSAISTGRTIAEFATVHGWKVTDARNVDAFLFVPASRRKSQPSLSDDLLNSLGSNNERLGRFTSKTKTTRLMQSHCAAKH